MIKKRIVLVPEKISISLDSKIKGIHYFPLGECFSNNIFEDRNESINIDLNVVSTSDSIFQINNPIYSTKDYKIIKDTLYYSKKCCFFDFKILIERINSNNIRVFVNNQYWKLIKFKIENLYPVGIQLTDLLLLKAIERGDLIMHGASLFNNKTNNAFLIMSAPAVGKTYTAFSLLQDKNYQYLAEEISYYDGRNNELFCVPFSSSWNHHRKIFFRHKNITNIFSKNKIQVKATLKRVYLLEYAKEEKLIKICDNVQILNKILNLQRSFFSSYSKNPLLRTSDYFDGNLNIENLYRKETLLYEEMLKDKEVYLVLSNNFKNFFKLIHDNEGSL